MRWIIFINLPNPDCTRPWVYLASNRNEYQKQKNISGEYSMADVSRLATSAPSVCGLSRQCTVFNISQLYRPPCPVRDIDLPFFLLSTLPP
jgi:hypothetical protein